MSLLRDPHSWLNRGYRVVGKRALDLAITVPVVLVGWPIVAMIAVAVRIDLGAPVMFRHRRPGKGGVPFELIKFRSMRSGAGTDRERLTVLGGFLRRSSLDELPTLWNVLRGEMSLVGPRPLLMEYLPRYSAEHARRHEVKPGVAGWAQVNGRHSTKFSERLARDVWYVDHVNPATDLGILARTVWQVVRRQDTANEQMSTAAEIDDVGLYIGADQRELEFER